MPATTVIEVLDALLALYAKPGTWRQDGIAWDAEGRPVAADSDQAVSWSLDGALERVIEDWEQHGVERQELNRRCRLVSDVFDALGADLSAVNDAARSQRFIVSVLQSVHSDFAAAAKTYHLTYAL